MSFFQELVHILSIGDVMGGGFFGTSCSNHSFSRVNHYISVSRYTAKAISMDWTRDREVINRSIVTFFLNILGNQFGVHIPINLATSAVSGFLGIPGLCALVAIDTWIL